MSSPESTLDRELVVALQADLQALLSSLQLEGNPRAAQLELALDADDLCTAVSELGVPEQPGFAGSIEEINSLATEFARQDDDPFHTKGAFMTDENKQWVRDQVLGRSLHHAVSCVLNRFDAEHGTWSHCSHFFRAQETAIGLVAQLDADAIRIADAWSIVIDGGSRLSIVREAVAELVSQTTRRVGRRRDWDTAWGAWHEEVLREAATTLMSRTGLPPYGVLNLFDALTTTAALQYEGRPSSGTIAFVPTDRLGSMSCIELREPISVLDHAMLRKLVEASSRARPLVSDGSLVHGMAFDGMSTQDPRIEFSRAAQWRYSSSGRSLFRVQGGLVRLPHARLRKNQLEGALMSRFAGLTQEQTDRLWAVASAVLECAKGAVLVVSSEAEQEALRLDSCAFSAIPAEVDEEGVKVLVNMDGAVLLDVDARVHAAGVILDGLHDTEGARSRGARLNATRRYVRSRGGECVALVVSEDGPFSLLQ